MRSIEHQKYMLRKIIRTHYVNMINNIFIWENFPTTGNLKYFLEALFYDGRASFYKNKNGILLTLKNCSSSKLNIYGYPSITKNIGLNYVEDGLTYIQGADNTNVNTVVLYNTPQEDIMWYTLKYYVDKYVELMLMYNTKVIQAKRPYIVTCSDAQKKNLNAIMNDIVNDHSIIVGNEALTSLPLTVLPTGIKISDVREILDLMNLIDAEIKEKFGINNNKNNDKKERLIVDEINNNNNSTNLTLDMALKSRELFCRQVNETFNIGLSVSINPILINGGGGDVSNVVQGLEKE